MHLAGQKLKAWRLAQQPPLSAEEFAARHGFKTQTVFGWESKGRVARADAQRKLAQLGICQPADWIEPAAPEEKDTKRMAKSGTHPFFDLHTHGFVRVAAATPRVRTADVAYNAEGIIEQAKLADERGVDLLLFPELSLSSYAIDDLHLQTAMLEAVERHMGEICEASRSLAPALVIGAPLRRNGRIYNCAVVIARGQILGVVPKSYLPNYREYYEKRWFSHGRDCVGLEIELRGETLPFGTDLLFEAADMPGFVPCKKDLERLEKIILSLCEFVLI